MSETKPVWSKRVSNTSINDLVVGYCAGRDVQEKPAADVALVPWDLQTNAAHAIMLGEQGILSKNERKGILKALLQIKADFEAGKAIIDPAAEDVHMSIEQKVTALTAEGMGGRLHTGRSRNDQVATDMMLWTRAEVATIGESIADLINTLINHAKKYLKAPMPGMTHMQPAMITTWGHAVAGYAVRVLGSLNEFNQLLDQCNQCPLGSAASFGSSWKTDRRITASLLGMEVGLHTTDAIWGRGWLEAKFGFAASQLLNSLSSIGQDLILYSTPPRQWLSLSHDVTTGSSIMPQKRNPDFAEVTRAKAGLVSGMLQSLLSLGNASPNGYNRDTQYSKYLVMDIADEIRDAPSVFAHVFETLTVREDAMRESTEYGFLNATDVADFLAQDRKLPFRLCYQVMGKAVLDCEKDEKLNVDAINNALNAVSPDSKPLTAEEMNQLNDPDHLLDLRQQAGSPNPEKTSELLESLSKKTALLKKDFQQRMDQVMKTESELWKKTDQIINS